MATRFRLTADATAPAVSPALQSYSHSAPATIRRRLLTSDASVLSTVAYTPDAADHIAAGDALHVQFVSHPMIAGIAFTNANTIKMCAQWLEANAGNNLFPQMWVGVYSYDGATLQRTLRTKNAMSTPEIAAVLTSAFHSTTQDGTTYTTVIGDRLVVELSASGTPVAAGGVQGHNASFRFGSDGAGGDLAENNTQTGTTLNGWFEVVPNITFVKSMPPWAPNWRRWERSRVS